MREYIKIKNIDCEYKLFKEVIPKDIIVIDHIESVWGDELINCLLKSKYDYIISKSKTGIIKRWTIPQKVKMFKRQQKLKELGI